MVNLLLQEPESALAPLRKLHTLLPDQPEVVHCIALAHDMMGDAQVRAGDKTCVCASAFSLCFCAATMSLYVMTSHCVF